MPEYRIENCECCGGCTCCCGCDEIAFAVTNYAAWDGTAFVVVNPGTTSGILTRNGSLLCSWGAPEFYYEDPNNDDWPIAVTTFELNCNCEGEENVGQPHPWSVNLHINSIQFDSFEIQSQTCDPFSMTFLATALEGYQATVTLTCNDPPPMMARAGLACIDLDSPLTAAKAESLGLDPRKAWFDCTTGEHLAHCPGCNLHPKAAQ